MGDASPLQRMVSACEQLLKEPPSDAASAQFLEQHPLQEVFGLLSEHGCDAHQVDAVSGALGQAMASPAGTALLPSAVPYAEAALQSPHFRLRRLGCEQLGRALVAEQDAEQQRRLESALVKALQDADTGVAGAAEGALAAAAAARPAAFQGLLSGESPAGGALRAMSTGGSPTQRMRAFALLVAAAAASRANAEQLQRSGAVRELLDQLDPSDPLACLVALQLLQELVVHAGAAAQLMQRLLLPPLLRLLGDPGTAAGALPIAARLVAAAADAGSGARGGARGGGAATTGHTSNGNGLAHMDVDGPAGQDDAAGALLAHMQDILDERGSASAEMEVAALDAACEVALPSSAAAALLAGASQLLHDVCSRALGRRAGPAVRLAALHALGSVAGVERAGEARDRGAALMPRAAEEALRAAVYDAVSGASGGAGAARSPAEAVLNLLQQPFDDTRSGVYRCCSALALRPWFAADACANSALLARLCSPDSESGRQACEWRHSTVMALWATAQYLAALPGDAPEAQFARRLTAAARQQLAAAARAGPYGAGAGGGGAAQQSHFVATVPR